MIVILHQHIILYDWDGGAKLFAVSCKNKTKDRLFRQQMWVVFPMSWLTGLSGWFSQR